MTVFDLRLVADVAGDGNGIAAGRDLIPYRVAASCLRELMTTLAPALNLFGNRLADAAQNEP